MADTLRALTFERRSRGRLLSWAVIGFVTAGNCIAWTQNPPQVDAAPSVLPQGSPVSLHMSGFAPNSRVVLQLDGATVPNTYNTYTNFQGTVDRKITIPAGLQNGVHRIVVGDLYGHNAQAPITVQGNCGAPTIQLFNSIRTPVAPATRWQSQAQTGNALLRQ